MDAYLAGAVNQAQGLRVLCAEFAHGARRAALMERLDGEIEGAMQGILRLTVLLPNADERSLFPNVPWGELAAESGGPSWLRVRPIEGLASAFTSPAVYGQMLHGTDVLVLFDRSWQANATLHAAIGDLSEAVPCICIIGSSELAADDPMRETLERFGERRTVAEWAAGRSPAEVLQGALADTRSRLASAGLLKRLPLIAESLLRETQAEVAELKWRSIHLARARKGDDPTPGDPREQADSVKALLEEWNTARKEEIARSNEDGVLPFDARLLVTKLGTENLILRKEHSVAENKYTFLQASWLQGLVTRKYTVLPDPAVIDSIRSRMVNALDLQVRKDIELLNQQAGELMDRLRRADALYPLYAQALKEVRLPVMQRGDFDRHLNSVTLEVDIEDSHSNLGLFKRLAEGRMFASMAFSFVTMSAGVFVLFGEPSIKRGLMKFSGVIVIVMILYFIFSMLLKSDEEKKSLEDKLEKIREQVFQALQRPLGKAQQGIVKGYMAFLEEVKLAVALGIESVGKQHSTARAQLTDRKKAEDERIKGFLQRRQQAASALNQRLQQYLQGLDRIRTSLDRPAMAVPAPGATGTSLAAASITPRVRSTEAPPPIIRPTAPVRSAALERLAALAKRSDAPTATAPPGEPSPPAPTQGEPS